MRKLILLLAAALPLCAQLTTVTGTLSGPLGNGSPSANRLTATLTFKALSTFHAANGAVVPAQSSQAITVTGGAFSLALVPTDTGSPQGQYEVTGRIPLQTPDGRNCEVTFTLVNQGLCTVPASTIGPLYLSVPTSATPVNFGDWYTDKRPPAPPLSVQLTQLVAGNSVADGNNYCLSVVNHKVVGVAVCSGASLTLTGLTNSQLASLTNSQLLSLGN